MNESSRFVNTRCKKHVVSMGVIVLMLTTAGLDATGRTR